MPKPPDQLWSYLGIDPGKSGGLVCIDRDGGIDWWVMPANELDLLQLLQSLPTPVFAGLELVHSMPRDAAKAAFSFGHG